MLYYRRVQNITRARIDEAFVSVSDFSIIMKKLPKSHSVDNIEEVVKDIAQTSGK